MAQTTYSAAPPKAADFDYVISQLPGGIKSIEIDNGSALTLTVVADGQVVRTIAAYVARFCLNTSGAWDQVIIKRNNATIQATDSLTIVAYDGLVIPPLLPSFGPAAWGAGAVPNSLQAVSAGDQFLSWQVQQLINLLTGVMTGQPVRIGNTFEAVGAAKLDGTLEVVGVVTADLNIVVGSGSKNAAIPSPALEVQAVTVPGEVSVGWYNGGGVVEWRWRQPAGQTGNWSDFGSQIGAAFTQMLRVYPSGGIYIGNAPADPGTNALQVAGDATVEGILYALKNLNAVYPASIGGVAIGANFTGGAAEVDFFNLSNTALQSFRFYQKTGANTANLLLSLFPNGRVTAPSVGASAKPLTNFVPLTTGNVTTFTPVNNVPTSQALTGLPASAVAVDLAAQLTNGGATALSLWLSQDNTGTNAIYSPEVGVNANGISLRIKGKIPCNGSSIFYNAAIGAPVGPVLSITVLGYHEPS